MQNENQNNTSATVTAPMPAPPLPPGQAGAAVVMQPAQPIPQVGAMPPGERVSAGKALRELRDSELVETFLELCSRVGLGLVFVINAVSAIVQPDSFRKLIEGNFISAALGHTQLMLYLIAINDAVLGLLILSGRKKRYAYAWAGIWLFIVTFMKFTSLL